MSFFVVFLDSKCYTICPKKRECTVLSVYKQILSPFWCFLSILKVGCVSVILSSHKCVAMLVSKVSL